jgi:hypothetical protein
MSMFHKVKWVVRFGVLQALLKTQRRDSARAASEQLLRFQDVQVDQSQANFTQIC